MPKDTSRAMRLLCIALVLAPVACFGLRLTPDSSAGAVGEPAFPRPEHADHAKMARWLVHETDWGVISTTSRRLGGVAYGSVASHADGARGHPTGRVAFFLTTMDSAAYDAEAEPHVSYTIAEKSILFGCPGLDAEEPTCAKLTATGKLRRVPAPEEAELAQQLFARHPAMRHWPKGHAFHVYELQIERLTLLDFYGGAIDVSVDDYFAAKLGPPTA